MSRSLLYVNRLLGGTYCLHLQARQKRRLNGLHVVTSQKVEIITTERIAKSMIGIL
jgi:hypothetical protein